MKFLNMEPLLKDEMNDLYIKSFGKIYDFHNDADFKTLEYFISDKKVNLIWDYPSKWFINDAFWWNNKSYLENHKMYNKISRKIKFEFEAVLSLQIDPRDKDMPFTEDNTLSDILIEDSVEPDYAKITFEFQSGMRVIIDSPIMIFVDLD